MKYNPYKHQRRSIRLKGFDYTNAGAYFITICTQNRECLLGNIVERKMILNDAGTMIKSNWIKLPERFDQIIIDEFCIMPNHIHGIIINIDPVGASLVDALNRSDVDTQNETIFNNNCIENNINVDVHDYWAGTRPAPTFALGNIIGAFKSITTNELIAIRQYIINNPLNWQGDNDNPNNWEKK